MKHAWMGGVVLVAFAAYACSGNDTGGTAQPSAAPDDRAGGGASGDFSEPGNEGAAPSSSVGGGAAAPSGGDECTMRAAAHVSASCAACVCAPSGGCSSRVAACGDGCWALLACVETACGGSTDDTQCILEHCDLSDTEGATRAGSCVARCSAECAADLVAIDAPPDAGAPGPDGGGAAADTCPGEAIALTAASPTASASGSTATLSDDTESYCAKDGTGASDAIYAVTVEQAGTLTVGLASATASFDGVLYVTSSCGEAATTVACTDRDGTTEQLALPVDAGTTLYAVVESREGGEGDYAVDFIQSAAVCGDGAVNPGEACDFGDTAVGDGCDAVCQFEAPTDASDTCPGEVGTLLAGTPVTITSFTVGYSDSYNAPCGAEAGAPDRVFAFNPQTSGTLTATLQSSFDGVLSVYETCNVPNLFDLRLCADAPRASADESVSVEVTGGAQYFIVVDGYRATSMGTFELTVGLTP